MKITISDEAIERLISEVDHNKKSNNDPFKSLCKLSKKLFVFSTACNLPPYLGGIIAFADKESIYKVQNYYENILPAFAKRRYYILEEDWEWIYSEGVNMRELDVGSFEELVDKVEKVMQGIQVPQKLYFNQFIPLSEN